MRFIALFVFLISIIGCEQSTSTQSKERPIPHWVFRSVLDSKPRMITMALSDDLWASYYAESGALYKAWKGSVYFDGAVYTTTHGPQPVSIGNSYVENKYVKPWLLLSGKDTITPIFNYKGHKFVDHKVRLMYELTSPSTKGVISIEEEVDSYRSESGQAVFERIFTSKNVPDGMTLVLKSNFSSIAVENNISTDGRLVITKKENFEKDGINSMLLDALVLLNSNKTTKLATTFLVNPMISNNNVAGDEAETGETADKEALRLIGQSDCKTCHNKNLQTIGPSYVDIAKKYQESPENIALLSQKIKKGGSGVWGEQMMTPHPDLGDDQLKTMVTYILSLAEHEGESTNQQAKKVLNMSPISDVKLDDLLPGSVVSVYNIPPNTLKIPTIQANKKPIYAGVMPNFDNLSGGDFKALSDNFALMAQGYLKIDTAGIYTFHIWSDDGSKLYINDTEVIDNDGAHGTEHKEVKIGMSKGFYRFKIDYFQGGGGKFLSFNWKKPNGLDFEVISEFDIFHALAQQANIKDNYLPMSEISKIPGDQFALQEVHPAFDLYQARPNDFKPKVGGLDFKSNGQMVVCTWDKEGSVYLLDNANTGDTTKMKYKRIAFGLAEPLGLKVVQDTIYVLQKQEITRLVDTDGDDIIDEYQTLCDDWKASANFHEFAFGLVYKDGYFYGSLATAINPGGASTQPQIPDRGKVFKVSKNTGALQFIASGLRTPNGIGLGYKNELFVADNQGDWLPASKIVHVTQDAWFGSRSVDPEGTKDKKENLPLVWLPQDEIGNSPSTPLALNLGLYKDQMIHGEVTHGGVKRVFVEEVNGQLQGAVFRFIQGLEAGVNRILWGPNGDLYVGGIGNPGNWGHSGKLHYGLQRLVFKNRPVFEMLAVRAKTNGMEIEFTETLNEGDGWNPEDFEVKQWYYKPTIEYGGPKLDERILKVKAATVSDDRKKVFLEFDGQKDNHMIYIRLKNKYISESGLGLWSTEAWYTMNQVPKNIAGISKKSPYKFVNNSLNQAEVEAGWELLFDGKSLNGWHNFKKKTIGKSWVIDEEAIHLNAKANKDGHWQAEDGGDLVTDEKYEDFELYYDWKIGKCGNSGLIFNIVESDKYDYVWQTGPEMQILDNSCHPDTKFVTHRAGDLYDMIACKYLVVKQAGFWNKARIKSYKNQVEFWVNGVKVVAFTMHDDTWKEMILKSKFKDMLGFGMSKGGHIALQDHGDKVWFRNLKIRALK